MTVMFDKKVFWDTLRGSVIQFPTSRQVIGTEVLLARWEQQPLSDDLRWLAYMLATTYHETAGTMEPIEEYGKGADQPYGLTDPETSQTYYGRGYVQLTWRDNYARVDEKCGYGDDDSLEWHAKRALEPEIAVEVLFRGMDEGWFRGDKLSDHFNDDDDDPYNAREIINGDKTYTPSWAHGETIGNLITDYHFAYLEALDAAAFEPATV
jgi:hypothetical protein